MKTHYLVVLIIGALVLSACSPSAGGSPAPTQQALDPNALSTAIAETMQAQNPTQAEQPGGAAGVYQPVDNSICSAVQQSLQPLYPTVNFAVSIEPFADMSGTSGTACVISGSGTGNDFVGDVGTIAGTIGTTLSGYIQDTMYAADGATGTISGYRNGNSLAVVSVEWEPSPNANCPADQPIASCNLQPGDKLYTVLVSMASNGPAALVAPTFTPVPPSAPTAAPDANLPCDKAEFVMDVTVPDGTTFFRGDNFEKTWKIKNTGTCTWDTGYFIQYENGPLQPKNPKIYLNANVAPAQSVDITASYNVVLNPGTYRSNWSLRNSSGVIVPFSNTGNNVFYTEIKVKSKDVATVPAASGTILSVTPVITFESGSDLAVCGQFATYTVTIWVSTDGPVQTNYEIIVSDTSGFAANGSFVGYSGPVTGTWIFPGAVAGAAEPLLRIVGPYDDPTGITVRVKTGGTTWPPVTVTCP